MADSFVGSLYEVYNTVSTEVGMKAPKAAIEPYQPPGKTNGKHKDINESEIFEMTQRGNLQGVKQLVSQEGAGCLSVRDRGGHTPIHWAALNGHTAIVQFIIEAGGIFDEPSIHELGQQPIHWAAVNGHVPVVDALLEAGVSIDTVDTKHCTPLVIAAQYGRVVMVAYLLGRGANITIPDQEGDTAVHWAAFKGHADIMRLLIYSGGNPHVKDNFGQTPLHLGAISGDLNLVRDLCRVDKVDVNVVDRNGKTPLMLAAGRERFRVESFLRNEIKERARLLPKINFRTIVFGPAGNSKGPILFLVISVGFWGYPMYIFRCIPLTYHIFPWLHYIFMVTNCLMWISLYHANSTDPGYLPRNIPEYDITIKQASLVENSLVDEWGMSPMSRLCHTCRTVKKLRSKHCRICNRCVAQMDHHCPYVYNCIGENNRVAFHLFVNVAFILSVMSLVMAVTTVRQGGLDFVLFVSTAALLFLATVVSLTWFVVWKHAIANITTNEAMNKKRYKYLKDHDGNFRNPFDKGWKNNLSEYFYLRKSTQYSQLSEVHVL